MAYLFMAKMGNSRRINTVMNTKKLKIIIFDGSFETTAFIRRLMAGLQKNNQVFVLGFNEELKNKVVGVNYIKLGSNQSKLSLIKTSLKNLGLSISFMGHLVSGERKKLQKENLKVVLNQIQPDVIHAQWNSVLPWLEPYLKSKQYNIMLSQRGYHTNVRPFVNKKNYTYLQQIYPQLSGLHSVSQAISEQGKKIGVPFTGIDQVVYTGLNLKQFPDLAAYFRQTRIELISVGRGHWIKDYSLAIQTCAILKKENINFHYTLIGAAGNEELIYLINSLGLESFISLTEKLPFEEVQKMVSRASLSLVTSIEEGIANVAVESMALGTPVISTDCGGMKELITHQQEGWIVPKRNPIALAQQIEQFTKFSVQEIERIRHAARLKVEHQFNENQMVEGMEKLYLKILQNEKQSN